MRMEQESEKRLYARTKTFSIFTSMFSNLIRKFEMEYWVTNCGTDGYLYLLFQRSFLKLTIQLSVVSILMSLLMNLFVKQKEDDHDYISKWFDRAALQNKEFSNYRGWFHVLMVLVNTILTIKVI
jgi:hypothetical protein